MSSQVCNLPCTVQALYAVIVGRVYSYEFLVNTGERVGNPAHKAGV